MTIEYHDLPDTKSCKNCWLEVTDWGDLIITRYWASSKATGADLPCDDHIFVKQ